MRSRLFALLVPIGLLAGESAHAQVYCGRTVAFAIQGVVQVRQGGAWVDALNLPNTAMTFRIAPDCQGIAESGATYAFGQEVRAPDGTTMRVQREANSIAFLATDQRATASGVALVLRVDLSPRLLARNACVVAIRLAGSQGGGAALTVQNRPVPIGQSRVVPRAATCVATLV